MEMTRAHTMSPMDHSCASVSGPAMCALTRTNSIRNRMEPAEPAEAAAAEQQVRERSCAGELDTPNQFGADESAEDAANRRVGSVLRQTAPAELAREDGQADERGHRHHHAKAGDLERPDA